MLFRLTLVLTLWAQLVRSEVYPVLHPDPQLISNEVWVMPEDKQPLSPAQVTGRDDFVPLSAFRDSLRGQEYYWLKFDITNQVPDRRLEEWVLRLTISISRAEVFVLDGQSVVDTFLTGFFIPVEQRDFAPILKANLVKFDLPPGSSRTMLIRLRSDRSSVPPDPELRLESAVSFFHALQQKKQSNALFLGFCLMMLIYTLILNVYSGDRTYAHYAVYLVSIGIYVAYANGDIHDLVIPTLIPDHPEYVYLVKLSLYGALVGYMSFFRSFLDLQQLLPFWDRFFRLLSWLALPVLLLDLYLIISTDFSYLVSDRVTLPYIFAFVGTSLVFTFFLYRTRDRKGYFVVAGLIFMGLGILITAIDRLQNVDFSIRSFEIGATFELVVFSIGLAYRQAVIRREKQRAQFELEKSQLIQEQEHAEVERQRELHHLKSELYTNITHELRTPLTVIKGMSDQIRGHEREKELINRNIHSLLRLVNHVMDLSHLEAGKMELQLVQADVIHFARYLSESFDSSAESKNIDLIFQTIPDQLLMDFDSEKLQQIIYNLLSNAIKFTPEGGSIQFSISTREQEADNWLVLKVADTGRGIPRDELPHIFDRFYQSQIHYHQQYGGSGIGLALTKQLVHLMDGRIEVTSTPGKGTTFRVILPIRREAARETPDRIDLSGKATAVTPEINRAKGREELPQILIVEDNKDVITYLQTCLEGRYQITKASNGKKGLELALSSIPDLIISDVMMPEMNGYDLCQQLKSDHRSSHIPIIILTAKADREFRLDGLNRGADVYLTKPFDEQELLIRIEQLLESRKNLQQHFLRSGLLDQVQSPAEENEEALFLSRLKGTVMEQIDNTELNVQDLAAAVHLGHSQLYRKLKALTGLTPLQFLKKIRLDRASGLLSTEGLSVAEVAYAVGFSDPNYFSRAFQQYFGHPPREHSRHLRRNGLP
ncbi:hypothetical protein CRP01_30945 [Flavilitoribacter nigricans DSM 23189 = NBRC 102662]|uniref:histidine kinase n=2 Tax=Flavilitoribacter TaxID=2762562 RepID=A0A2D0N281_FLAN2|nr:hypothetical protein CRP01_30945 [Flavilitoribacter nigricans DSM 23189 = NBRC 102662]